MTSLDTFISLRLPPVWETLGAAFLLIAAFYGCGRILLRRHPGERVTAFALGWAVFMILFSLLPPVRLLLFCVSLPFALWGTWCWGRELPRFPGENAAGALLFLAGLGAALVLPYSWDEQTYQLALPLRYLQEGVAGPFPDNPYSFYPALTSWFFANAVTLGGLRLPRILVSFVTPVLIVSVWRLVRPCGRGPAWAAAGALLLSPLTLALNRSVYVENFIALFTFAGALCARRLLPKVPLTGAWVCGILAGAAGALKPTGIVGALVIFILFAGTVRKWKPWILFGAAAFITGFFWYLRTFFFTGNFFYPYAFSPVPGSVEHFHCLLGSHRYGLEGLPGVALNWLFAGFYGRIFDGIVTGVHIPLLTAAAAIFVWMKLKEHPDGRRRYLFFSAAAVIPYLLWSRCFPQTRFLMPLLPFLAAAGCLALARLPYRRWSLGVLALFLAGAGAFQAAKPLRHYWISWRIAASVCREPVKGLAYLTGDPDYFRAMDFISSAVPDKGRVLLLFERRGLYCPRPYGLAVPGFEPSLTPVPVNSEELLEKFRGFDYIMVGETTRDVDLQSANAEGCKKVLLLLRELIDGGRLALLPSPGYTVLKVIK